MPHQFSSFADARRQLPVTLCLVGLSVVGFLLLYLPVPVAVVSMFTFSPFELVAGQVQFQGQGGQLWRLITPVFLHFGLIHIIFNCLWLWEMGGLIELHLGKWYLLGLFFVFAIGSNSAQFVYSGPSLFGGMSGVVYGLLGFCWIYSIRRPEAGLLLPQPIVIFMLVWLVFCIRHQS